MPKQRKVMRRAVQMRKPRKNSSTVYEAMVEARLREDPAIRKLVKKTPGLFQALVGAEKSGEELRRAKAIRETLVEQILHQSRRMRTVPMRSHAAQVRAFVRLFQLSYRLTTLKPLSRQMAQAMKDGLSAMSPEVCTLIVQNHTALAANACELTKMLRAERLFHRYAELPWSPLR